MGAIADAFNMAWRDFNTDGVESSGEYDPQKSLIRPIGASIESALATLGIGELVAVTYATQAELFADLAHAAGAIGLVYADPTAGNNDFYVKTGASGTGGWTLTSIIQSIISSAGQPLLAQVEAWVQSDTSPDPDDPSSKSAKGWVAVVQALFAGLNIEIMAPETGYCLAIIARDGSNAILVTNDGLTELRVGGGFTLPLASVNEVVETAPESNIYFGASPPGKTGAYIGYDGLFHGEAADDFILPAGVSQAIETNITASLLPGNAILFLGDSYTALLPTAEYASANGRTVINAGWGSQKSNEIDARFGPIPANLTAASNTIAASGATTITAYDTDVLYYSNVSGGHSLTGTWGGVHGTLSGSGGTSTRNSATYTFTRTTAGTAVTLSGATPFIPDNLAAWRNLTMIVQVGRNNPIIADNRRDQLAILNGQQTKERRILFRTISTLRQCGKLASYGGYTFDAASYANDMAVNADLIATMGPERVIDERQYLIDHAAEAAAWTGTGKAGDAVYTPITLTDQDLACVANDCIPHSFYLTDGVHLIPQIFSFVLTLHARRIAALGW